MTRARNRMLKICAIVGGILALLGIALGAVFLALSRDLPDPEQIQSRVQVPSIQILDRHDLLLYEDLGPSLARHRPLAYTELPPCIVQATVATEDQSFFANPGFDLKAMLRALWINLRSRQVLAGGSTITQQVVRNLLMDEAESTERTLRRKLREIILAWRLSRRFSKEEILALYLNQTYYGSFAYGVEAAAQTYFGKPASELSLAECALIAGLPQAPAHYNPFIYPERAQERQKVVLERMFRSGFISREQKERAAAEKLLFAEQPFPMEAPHFVMLVRNTFDQLESRGVLPKEARRKSLVIRTTLDLHWQKLAEQAISDHLQRLSRGRDGLGHNVKNAALVAIDPRSGAILAMVGSPNYYDKKRFGAINMALVPRQPGSALKPFIYALAIDPGSPSPLTAASLIDDVRTTFRTRDGKAYIPANYDGKEHGKVTVREALASSLNIPAVAVLERVGLERFAAFMQTLGVRSLDSPDRYDLTIALGGGGVSLLELTAAYSLFATNGFLASPYWIESIADTEGTVYYQASPQVRKVLDERVAWLISDILSDDSARAIGFGRHSILNIGRPAAVKTGTTTDFHDNWTVGYTPSLVVGVWVGNADYEPMVEVTGLSGAAPIWHQFMRSALANHPVEHFVPPAGLVRQAWCKQTADRNSPCSAWSVEWFIQGTEPQPPLLTSAEHATLPQARLSILSPLQNGVYLLPPYSAQAPPKLPIEIRPLPALTHIRVFLNDEYLATLEPHSPILWWPMRVGEYLLRVEGWQEEHLVEQELIRFSVRPPLR